jgi:hypothetical protein
MDADTRGGFVVATNRGWRGRRPLRLGLGVALGLGLLLGVVFVAGARGGEASQGAGESRWLTETVDSAGYVGEFTSLALEPVSPYTPHISYRDISNSALKHAWRAPTGWVSETVDSEGDVGHFTSLALEPVAPYTPHISYYDWGSNRNLKHAWRTPIGWMSETVDASAIAVGEYTSLALEPVAPYTPHIGYLDDTNDALKHAWRTSTGWLSETVDSQAFGFEDTSLALEPAPPYTPHISYYHVHKSNLKHAWWTPAGWLSETVDGTGSDAGRCNSLALEPNSPYTLHISYWSEYGESGILRHAWRSPSGWLSETLDTTPGEEFKNSSIAFEPGPSYVLHISYWDDHNGDLKHAWLVIFRIYLPLALMD